MTQTKQEQVTKTSEQSKVTEADKQPEAPKAPDTKKKTSGALDKLFAKLSEDSKSKVSEKKIETKVSKAEAKSRNYQLLCAFFIL